MAAQMPEGWQFSRGGVVVREVTARLIGPFLGWFLVGPRVVGGSTSTALEGPSLICPTHASHFDFSAHPPGARPEAPAPAHRSGRRRLLRDEALALVHGRVAGRVRVQPHGSAAPTPSPPRRACSTPAGTWSCSRRGRARRPARSTRSSRASGLLARRTGRQVLPVRIVGIRGVLPKGARRPHGDPGGGPVRRAAPGPAGRGCPRVHRPPGGVPARSGRSDGPGSRSPPAACR